VDSAAGAAHGGGVQLPPATPAADPGAAVHAAAGAHRRARSHADILFFGQFKKDSDPLHKNKQKKKVEVELFLEGQMCHMTSIQVQFR